MEQEHLDKDFQAELCQAIYLEIMLEVLAVVVLVRLVFQEENRLHLHLQMIQVVMVVMVHPQQLQVQM